MKRLREIVRGLFTISRQPSSTIAAAWANVRRSALPSPDSGTLPADNPFMQCVTLIDDVVAAVAGFASEEEANAAKKGSDA